MTKKNYEDRPWGSFTVLDEGISHKVKRIKVSPGGKLSLQKHKYRSEHWIVVSGQAEVTKNDKTFILEENQSTYFSPEEIHSLHNPTKNDLYIIEIQYGEYLGEDDIERLEDIYGRSK